MGRRTLLLIVACTALVAVAASSAAADPIPITITPPADFGSVLEGQASTPQTLTIQNTGAAAITLNQLTLAGTDTESFSIPVADDACSNATLNSGDTCDFNVVFNPPSGAGERGVQTSLIDVGDTAGDDAQEVDFSGTAVAPQIDVPGSLPFGSVQLGQSSSQIVTVQNDGQGELDVTTPASPGGDFTVSPTGTTCTGAGAHLTPGDSCNVNVVFTPSATGAENATLVVPSNDPDTPSAQVPVSGTGTQGAVTFDPTSLTFTTHLGTTSPSQTISVQNTGTAPLTIAGPGNGVKINGTNQSNFAVTGDGCTSQTLQVGDSCDVSISFTTTVMAQRTANLQIKDDGAGGTQLAPLSGTGIQSGPVTVTPTSNNFGSVAEGSSSSAQTFTFTNTGGDSVTFPNAPGTFSLTGANPGDFSTANDGCSGQTIGAGDTCSVDVTFSPPVGAGVRGARSATLSVTGGFVNSPLTVKLTGTATAPAISVPSTVNFGNVPVGGQPGQHTVTVKNNGAGTLTIGQIGAPSGAGFSIVTDGCSNTGLTAGQTCSVVLQFQPSSTGAATGTLQIPHNDPDTTNPVSISLTATGTQVGPVTISPTSATFGSVVEGSSSLPKTFTVTNTGTAPLTGLSVGLGGSGQSNFTITTDNCSPSGTTVNPGKSCTFKVEFSPAQGAGVRGPQTATVTVSGPANASGLPQSLGLSGTATAPTISLPASYDFGNVPIGQTATHAITVKNTGSGTLDVTGQKITSPGFSVSTDGCAAPTGLLAAGDSCTITVQFQSTEVGTASGTLSVPNNDPDAAHPAQVSLSATGTMAGPVTVTPGTKTFSSQVEGTTSAAQTFTVTNTGTAPVALGPAPVVSLGGASPGSFTLSGNTCASLTQLGAAKSCVFKVAFSPPVAAGTRGVQNASVTVNGGADLPQTVPLSGTATSPTLNIPNSLGFGSTLVGTPVSNKVTISNSGTGTLNVAFQNITGAGFSVGTNACAGTAGKLTTGKSCSITVVFNPSSPGPANGTLKVTDNDPDSPNPASVSLTGTGTQIGPVTLGPGSNNFGSQLEGTSSNPQTFTVTNTGTATLTVGKVSLGGANAGSFALKNDNCTAAHVTGGAACTFQVVFSPPVGANVRGTRTATVSVTGNAPNMPGPSSLTGNATAPEIGVPGNVVDFGNVPVGTTAQQQVAVTNIGQGTLVVGAVSTMGSGFSVANNGCAGGNGTLNANQSCNITVAYQSTNPGSATGALQVSSNDPDVSGTTPVTLTATGTQPSVSITGNTAFSTAVGTTSSPQAITVHNTGNAPLKITTVSLGGANPTSFAKSSDGCSSQSVAAGNTCVINVTFTASDTQPQVRHPGRRRQRTG